MIIKKIILIFLIILIIISYYLYIKYNNIYEYKYFFSLSKNNQNYIKEYRCLNRIKKYNQKILEEVNNVNKNLIWSDWPEKELYSSNNSWKVFPFVGFGKWIEKNCNQCPHIYKFLHSIPNIKLAILSKLSPKMKLTPHRGWGSHSNHVLRCHYGIIVPKYCYISVSNSINPPLFENDDIKLNSYPNKIEYKKDNKVEEIYFHKTFEWLIFDDSETHYAENLSDTDRIVLIIDIQRPESVKTGTSSSEDTKELLELVKYYKETY
jgi:hypothetical protein